MKSRTTTKAAKAGTRQCRRRVHGNPRPFLKWAGGKGQSVGRLLELVPRQFRAYHEPFLGGGALFYALHRSGRLGGKKVCLSDINSELIATYRAVRDDVGAVIGHLEKHRYDREYYYSIRALDPTGMEPAALAARMIYLNRTGFNGLYRVNRRGEFNVPFGRYKKPRICDRENLEAVSTALRGVEIEAAPFERVLERAQVGEFVYCDPPYVPLSETASFVGYAHQGFSSEDQERLARVFEALARRGVYVMLSNSDTPWVRSRYRAFRQEKLLVNRSVNSRADRRGPVGELVVLSY